MRRSTLDLVAESLSSKVGKAPVGDSLASASWMYTLLGEMANEVLADKTIKKGDKRAELLKIADRMAALRDADRIFRAEQALRGQQDAISETTRGPQLQDAPKFDQAARPVTARRGRPPRSAIR